MPLWLTICLALGGSAFIGCLVSFLFNSMVNGTKAKAKKREEEQMEAFREVIREENKPIINDLQRVKNGNRSALRKGILDVYYKCRDERHYRTDYDIRVFDDLLNDYHALDGNSYINEVAELFKKIPTKAEYNSKKGEKD